MKYWLKVNKANDSRRKIKCSKTDQQQLEESSGNINGGFLSDTAFSRTSRRSSHLTDILTFDDFELTESVRPKSPSLPMF